MASAGRCNTLLRQIVSFDPLDGTNMVGVSSAAQTLTFDWCKADHDTQIINSPITTWCDSGRSFDGEVAEIAASLAVASVGAVVAATGTGACLPSNPATNFIGKNEEAAEGLLALAAEVLSIFQ